jgi:hypothetical protein
MSTEEIRAMAMALPEVTEKQHFRLKVPLWQVHGKTFLGMGRDETTAVFCITEQSAHAAATADPEHAAAVRRMDARRSFLGLEVQLSAMTPERVEALVHEAWAAQAPKRLVNQHLP